ncbi:MAG: hypothetical protein RLN76_02365 [Phycisphaeraceae bacterium]
MMMLMAQGPDLSFLNDTGNLAFVLGIGAGVVYIISTAVVRSIRIREEAALKARLIERGASAEEIERILNAGGKGDNDAC